MTASAMDDDPSKYPWDEVHHREAFSSTKWTRRIQNGLPVATEAQRKLVVRKIEEAMPHCLSRLRLLHDELKNRLVEKDELIHMVIVSAIAGQPMLLVGKPGTAKSIVITRFCEGLGVGRIGSEGTQHGIFRYLLHGFTEPDEVLGPVNISKLQQSPPVFERLHEGSITDAEVIFLDEVFRANSAILNSLLSIMNERQVYEGGRVRKAKARLIFGASNSTPSGNQLNDLRAFYERFIIRMESAFVSRDLTNDVVPASRAKLMMQGWANEVSDLRAGYVPEGSALNPISCLNDLLLLNRAVAELYGGPDLREHAAFLLKYQQLVLQLVKDDDLCDIDDRKLIRLFAVIRAHALFGTSSSHRPSPPQTRDLAVLKHVWRDVDHKVDLGRKVQDFIDRNPK